MSADAPALVRVRDVALAYRDRPALRGVDLSLQAGESLVLLGPNGAGKSSLLRVIAGRLKPHAGRVEVAAGDPATDRRVRRRIGWVPQDIALYPRLTVRENLDTFARLAGLSRRERRRVIAELVETTGLSDVAHRLVGTLSGGFQRRVNIAASLVGGPHLILLDEPTQGVDLDAREAIHALLLRLRARGAAILLSTHDFPEAERLGDRVAILREGQVLLSGGLAALLRPYADAPPEQEAQLETPADAPVAEALRRRGFVPSPDPLIWRADAGGGLEGRALLDALRSQGVRLLELRLRRPGLERLYRETLAPMRAAALPRVRTFAEALP